MTTLPPPVARPPTAPSTHAGASRGALRAWGPATGRGLAKASGLAILLGLLACAGAENVDRPRAAVSAAPAELTSDGLAMVRSTPRSRLWVKPDHHLGKYDDILVTGIGFAYGKGQERLGDTQEQQVGEMLREAIAGITDDTPVGQADAPGPCVLALQLGLKDIYLHISETSGSSVSYVSSFGSATMIVEFRDSTTDATLLRYAANRGLGGGPGTGQIGANLGRLGRALGEMVEDMTTELQTLVPDTTVRPETECHNGIYKMTGRG